MRCDICGKEGARAQLVTRAYGRGGRELLIRNVPVVTCPRCGESCLTANTLHEIERIKLLRRSLAERRQIEVAEFVRAPVGEGRPTRTLRRSARSSARR
jgi:YgiT-type zinc finger domain-containing protein